MEALHDQDSETGVDDVAELVDSDAPATPIELLDLYLAKEAGIWNDEDAKAFAKPRRVRKEQA